MKWLFLFAALLLTVALGQQLVTGKVPQRVGRGTITRQERPGWYWARIALGLVIVLVTWWAFLNALGDKVRW